MTPVSQVAAENVELDKRCNAVDSLDEFYFVDESLIYSGPRRGGEDLRSDENISVKDSARSVGVFGDSVALSTLLDAISEMAQNCDPVVFSGPTGSGKKTFAILLHRLTSHGTAAHAAIDCREQNCYLQDISALNALFSSLVASAKPSLTIVHPESLPRALIHEIIDSMEAAMGTVRFQFTVDSRGLHKFLKKVPSRLRRFLSKQVLHVPSLEDRAEDVRTSVLVRLGEMNRRFGLRKQISDLSLKDLIARKFPDNFHGLFRIVEWMYATQFELLNFDAAEANIYCSPPFGSCLCQCNFRDGFRLNSFIRSIRDEILLEAMRQSGHNMSRAARLLGVSPQAVSGYVTRKNRAITALAES
ncbi:MAG: sigma 54-interacting transcriptional regulator [Puniceicoccales bacterium]|jgi:hypothetical protein|nr:sigma 54-interacting transcriptional regulator [Puniceicoccales bacterium]